MSAARTIVACHHCGGMRVQWESWVDANRDTIMNESGDQKWCPRCQDHYKRVLWIRQDASGFHLEPPWEAEVYHYTSLRDALRAHREVNRKQRIASELA